MAVLESARGELDSAEMMLQQAESHLSNLALDPTAALASFKASSPYSALQNTNFEVDRRSIETRLIRRGFCSENADVSQAEDSKLTAQIASLQSLDCGNPAASNGGASNIVPSPFCCLGVQTNRVQVIRGLRIVPCKWLEIRSHTDCLASFASIFRSLQSSLGVSAASYRNCSRCSGGGQMLLQRSFFL